MKVTSKVVNPDDIEVSLTITMSLRAWGLLRSQLTSGYPAWDVSNAISSLTRTVEQTFQFDEAKAEDGRHA